MPSRVMWALTSVTGRWIVTRPTRRRSLHMIIIGSPSSSAARNSVWPVKRNPSPCIASLLIGAVTSASMRRALRSSVARRSAASAAAADSGVARPGSTVSRSPTGTIFTRPRRASSAEATFASAGASSPQSVAA